MLKSVYLFGYNAFSMAAWSVVLYQSVLEWQANGPLKTFDAVRPALTIAQTAAFMEIVHAALGIVRSPVVLTTLQVGSRLAIVWGVLIAVPQTRQANFTYFSVGDIEVATNTGTLMFAWAVTEIIRYSFYAIKEVGTVPYPLLWLRYTTFIVLYPLGVASELTTAISALPHMKDDHRFDLTMPNPYNFAFCYYIALWCGLFMYLPGLPQLYMYMLSQRKKVLNPKQGKTKMK
ncbi:hypothetical protein CYMTET_31313 [Cymbomonas tetramitiformis]|uniref:Very-long-chain (3R)-3-hydroxyacyl-CoA dehydratase n=1 Tax=Cymbomonas tetramitiformis TaxID=36881 RepID=A0AAE0FH11_9CHLO|nr:hypothetical protein CYMTET_31313 [Cymbomonas tetramitiformis]